MTFDAVDVLVFSPHPDDEVIGTGGVIQQALAEGKRVRVVFVTSGDGYQRAAARLAGKPVEALGPPDLIRLGQTRRAEAVAADVELGLSEDDLVFLGFPDGSFADVARAVDSPAVAPLTGQASSPTTGVPYTRAAALERFTDILAASQAERIYVTHPADEHPDHSASHEIVNVAMREMGSRSELFTFMVHAADDRWPDPGPCYETKTIDGVVYPVGVAWPPPIRMPMTPAQEAVKRRALDKHASQMALDREYLSAFVKTEEVFWPNRA